MAPYFHLVIVKLLANQECPVEIGFLLRGMVIGFAIAAPVGPIGLLCIQRTLTDGRIAGLVSGLGAATADAVYGMVAGFGLTIVSSFLVEQQVWLGAVGGTFLCYLGVRTFLAAPATQAAMGGRGGWWAVYGSTFLLTLTNPMTIFSFVAIFAGLGLATAGEDYLPAVALVVGVFLGSTGWWLLLSAGVALVRTRLTPGVLQWVNRAAGVIIAGFGLFMLVGLGR
jgi:threonine/homoserine/homoserine lactone efflux protein